MRHISLAIRWTMRLSRSSPPVWSSPAARFSSFSTSGVFVRDSAIVSSVPATGRRFLVYAGSGPAPLRSAQVAARHGQGDAGYVRSLVRGEEQDRRRLVLGGAVAAHQAGRLGLLHHLAPPALLLLALLGRGGHVARD